MIRARARLQKGNQMADLDSEHVIRVGPPGGGLYNVVHGQHDLAPALLMLLQLVWLHQDVPDILKFGRFRDAWVERQGDSLVIRVHTRNGGPNREEYDQPSLYTHPWFVGTEDGVRDNTYADYYFRADPDWFKGLDGDEGLEQFNFLMEEAVEHVDMDARWDQAVQDIQSGRRPIPAELADLGEKLKGGR